MKRFAMISLAALLVAAIFVTPALAQGKAADGKTSRSFEEVFPEGVPAFVTEEQAEKIMNGEYIRVEFGGREYIYNPENRPVQGERVPEEPVEVVRNTVPQERIAEEVFPDGVPDFVTQAQVEKILKGEYVKVETTDRDYIYNPEMKPGPIKMLRSADTVVWDEDMSRSKTFYLKHMTLEYTVGSWGGSVTTKTTYHIGAFYNDYPADPNPQGRVWTQIKATNGAVKESQSEKVFLDSAGQRKITTTVTVPGQSFAERIYFAARNLKVDWNASYEVY